MIASFSFFFSLILKGGEALKAELPNSVGGAEI